MTNAILIDVTTQMPMTMATSRCVKETVACQRKKKRMMPHNLAIE